jgi:hypothetical protein
LIALRGQEPIYQRRRGKEEREAMVMERRTRKYMRGAKVLLPDNFVLGSGIYLVMPRRGKWVWGMEKQKMRARGARGGGAGAYHMGFKQAFV